MPLSQAHVTSHTPMGANLIAGGATFRCWAPRAQAVHVVGTFGGKDRWKADAGNEMVKDAHGYWAGFLPGVRDGDQYKFYVVGKLGPRLKRDPYARELTSDPAYPICNCIVRDPARIRGRTWPGARRRSTS